MPNELLKRQETGSAESSLLRGASFYHSVAEISKKSKAKKSVKVAAPAKTSPARSDDSDASSAPALGARGREPTMLHSGKHLVPSTDRKYTVVLDLDETVVYGRGEALVARAHLKDMLRSMNEHAEVIVWTAGERSYAKAIVQEINAAGVIKHLVYRSDKWFSRKDYTKDLQQLGRDLDYVLIVENTPDCVRNNPQNGVIVDDFEGGEHEKDCTLLKLAKLVEDLVTSDAPVPKFLAKCPLLKRQHVDGEKGKIPIFFLGRSKAKIVHENRDKLPKPKAAGKKRAREEDEEDDDEAKAVPKKKSPSKKAAAAVAKKTKETLSSLDDDEPPAKKKPAKKPAAKPKKATKKVQKPKAKKSPPKKAVKAKKK